MSLPAEMTAIAISRFGGPEVLQPVRLPVPRPGPGEVVIRVAAAGLNAPDLGQRRGSYAPPPDASPLPGLEVGGEIVAVADDVPDWRIGAPVVALCHGGGYAEYVAVPAGQLLPAPTGWSLLAAAALPETFFTIEQTLVLRAGLSAGMTVLIHGAAGGIGGAAIQIGRLRGAIPIAVVSSPAKADYAQALGAAHVIDHSREDFVARTLELTAGRGADRVVDIMGGPTLMRNILASARFGHVVMVASLEGSKAEIEVGQVLGRQLTLSGSTLRPQSRAAKATIAASLLHHVWPALADGRIRPPRIRALPLAEAARGHQLLEQRDNYGKLILLTGWGQALLDAGAADNPIEKA